MFRRIDDFKEGMKAYPLELRERIVAAVDEQEQTIAEVAETFRVTERYIYKLLHLRRERGDLRPLPHGGGAAPLLNEARLLVVAELVAQYPDATLEEYGKLIAARCGVKVCLTTVWNALGQCALTRKKRRVGPRRPTPPSARPSGRGSRRYRPSA